MAREVPAHIQAIANAAVAAPSGDNSQPWHFVFRSPDTLEFHAHPEYDHPVLNVDNSGTLIALGAAVENGVLEARGLGYDPSIAFSNTSGDLIATMRLVPGSAPSTNDAALREAIKERASNRKAFSTRSLESIDREQLLAEARSMPSVSFSLIEDRTKMDEASRALTRMEQIALSHQVLHGHFFSSIFWSNERNDAGEPGLHGKTLELPPPAQALFRILKHWPIAKTFARIGFPRFVAMTNAKQNASASAFGCVMSDTLNAQSYFDTGRLLERLWLRATALGLSFQVVTGLLFLARHMESESGAEAFSPDEIQRSSAAYASIGRLFDAGARHPIITFRLGYGTPPTLRSRRKEPRIEVVE
ncbi:MAG TPA: hypothetical protein VGN56_01075 [Candidatus Paceibacterota bacterium]|jgi:hypothetical protein|nr:hypothetical protein [Candidatus Paceibacterota bacterium]